MCGGQLTVLLPALKTQIHAFRSAPCCCLPCQCYPAPWVTTENWQFRFPLVLGGCCSSVPSACPPGALPSLRASLPHSLMNKFPCSFPHPAGPSSSTRAVPAGWNNYLYLCYDLWNPVFTVAVLRARLPCLGLRLLLQALPRDLRSFLGRSDLPTKQLRYWPQSTALCPLYGRKFMALPLEKKPQPPSMQRGA